MTNPFLATIVGTTGVPVGTVIAFAGDATASDWQAANPNWLICQGQTVPQAQYYELYVALGSGTIYGGDEKTFTLPNYSAMFLRGVAQKGTGPNQDPGDRTAAAKSSDANGVGSTQTGMVQTHEHQYNAFTPDTGPAGEGLNTLPMAAQTPETSSMNLSGEETRPVNVYVYFLIKAASGFAVVGVPV